MTKIVKYIPAFVVLILSILLIGLMVKGDKSPNSKAGPIYYQTQMDTKVGGPFEASNSNSRYALVQALVNTHTFFLNTNEAKFASPDVVDFKGKFISIFTPGVSFIAVPFYLLGKIYSVPQITSYLSVTVFALLNLFLIAKIARKLGAGKYASLLSGFIFLFATNALAYSQSLSQHHMGTTFLLFAFLNALENKRTLFNNISFGAYLGIAALLDIPNPIIMLPLIAYVIYKNIDIQKGLNHIKITLKGIVVGLAIGSIPFIGIFAYYNHATTGSYFKLAQTIGRSSAFEKNLPVSLSADVPEQAPASFGPLIHIPFNTRSEVNGFYTLLISDERSWLFYSPVLLLGICGIAVMYRKKETKTPAILILSLILFNILLYSMFGDPWGGWAFGPRYLIPAASLACIALGVFIEKYKKNILFLFVFIATLAFSIGINTIGVLTTSAIPPKIEAINFPKPIPYTVEYNFQFIQKNTSSLLYNIALKNKITPYNYFVICMLIIWLIAFILFAFSFMEEKHAN